MEAKEAEAAWMGRWDWMGQDGLQMDQRGGAREMTLALALVRVCTGYIPHASSHAHALPT